MLFRSYVSPDGRFLDRCAYDTATIPDNPYTRMYGMPDPVPIDVEIMKQYARCAEDACFHRPFDYQRFGNHGTP